MCTIGLNAVSFTDCMLALFLVLNQILVINPSQYFCCLECVHVHLLYSCLYTCRYGRTDVVALGKFAVNLTNFPPSLVDPLHTVLETIVNKVMRPHTV